MKNYAIKMILAAGVLTCGLLGLAAAQDTPIETLTTSKEINKSSTAVQTFLAHETAILNKDYAKAWDLECNALKINRWKNNFEAFKKFYSERNSTPEEKERFMTIKGEKKINEGEVHLNTGSDQTFVIINENGKWCFSGVIEDVRSWKK